MDRESYSRGFLDALESLEYLIYIEKWPIEKAIDYLKHGIKERHINKILDELGIPKKLH
jgi:hypothetical protein